MLLRGSGLQVILTRKCTWCNQLLTASLVREDYSADGDAWSRKSCQYLIVGKAPPNNNPQISLTSMQDQELSDGARMELLVSQIHMACRTLLLLSGTAKSEQPKPQPSNKISLNIFTASFSRSVSSAYPILKVIMARVLRRHISIKITPQR